MEFEKTIEIKRELGNEETVMSLVELGAAVLIVEDINPLADGIKIIKLKDALNMMFDKPMFFDNISVYQSYMYGEEEDGI